MPDWPDAIIIVPDFTIFVSSSSCNSLFLGLILSSPFSTFTNWLHIRLLGCQKIEKESMRSENEADKERLHELPYREIVKSGTIRPASGFRAAKDDFESD